MEKGNPMDAEFKKYALQEWRRLQELWEQVDREYMEAEKKRLSVRRQIEGLRQYLLENGLDAATVVDIDRNGAQYEMPLETATPTRKPKYAGMPFTETLRKAVATLGKPSTIGEIMHEVFESPDSEEVRRFRRRVGTNLSRLAGDGDIKRVGRGKYVARNNEGKESAESLPSVTPEREQ